MNERQFSPRKLTKALSYLRILVRLYDANKPGFVAGVLEVFHPEGGLFVPVTIEIDLTTRTLTVIPYLL